MAASIADAETKRLLMADAWHAFVQVRPDPRGPSEGPLAGVRLVVKDNIQVQGMAYAAGQPLYAERQGQHTASTVQRLRAAGARLLGMTRTDAGGFGVTTPEVDNPRLPGHIAGGSSGGGAAALAAGLADLALCTDTGGSARIPAACCGVFGYKPTHGLFPTDGVWPLAPVFDDVGLMANRLDLLEQAACVLGAPVAPEANGPEANVRAHAANIQTQATGIRVQATGGRPGILRIGVDAQRAQAYAAGVRDDFLAMLQRLGMHEQLEIVAISLPDRVQVHEAHGTLVLDQARAIYAPVWPQHKDGLARAAQKALAVADTLAPDHVARMRGVLDRTRSAVERLFDRVDVVLTPTLMGPVPRVDQAKVCMGGRQTPVLVALTSEPCLANMTGCPAVVLPQPGDPPVLRSWQLMARAGGDALLFAAARQLHSIVLDEE
ncbi:amidase family protein [Castellaniella sp.]|uniref:amidase family protein n=1 Tax=Castellaniella sp. TaxID=1955812 RepID=UPI0035689E80